MQCDYCDYKSYSRNHIEIHLLAATSWDNIFWHMWTTVRSSVNTRTVRCHLKAFMPCDGTARLIRTTNGASNVMFVERNSPTIGTWRDTKMLTHLNHIHARCVEKFLEPTTDWRRTQFTTKHHNFNAKFAPNRSLRNPTWQDILRFTDTWSRTLYLKFIYPNQQSRNVKTKRFEFVKIEVFIEWSLHKHFQ